MSTRRKMQRRAKALAPETRAIPVGIGLLIDKATAQVRAVQEALAEEIAAAAFKDAGLEPKEWVLDFAQRVFVKRPSPPPG